MNFTDKNFYANAQTFCALVDYKTINQVSKQLDISIPTVNKRLDSLQDELNETIFTKVKKSVIISDKGIEFYKLFKKHETNLNQHIIDYKNKKNAKEIHFKISISNGIANQVITDKIAEYVYNNPNVNFDIDFQNREIDLVKEFYDLALVRYETKRQTIKSRKLFETKLNLYCTPEYIKKHGEPKNLTEFQNHLYLGNITDENINYVDLDVKDKANNLLKFEPIYRLATSNIDYAVLLAKTNDIIIPAFEYTIQNELRDGTLVKVLPELKFGNVRIYLIQLDKPIHPELDKFIQFIEKCFNDITNYIIT